LLVKPVFSTNTFCQLLPYFALSHSLQIFFRSAKYFSLHAQQNLYRHMPQMLQYIRPIK